MPLLLSAIEDEGFGLGLDFSQSENTPGEMPLLPSTLHQGKSAPSGVLPLKKSYQLH